MRATLILPLLLACTAGQDGHDDTDTDASVVVGPYEVDLRWTSYGVPHVRADEYGSAAYGMGYAHARDHGCVLLDQIVKVRGERARWEGPEHLDEAFGWRSLDLVARARGLVRTLRPEVRDVFVGYAAGVARWVEEGDLPPACADRPWVRPIDHVDLLAYALALTLDGSAAVFIEEIGRAVPPGETLAESGGRRPVPGIDRLEEIGRRLRDPQRGSNGWAIGRDRTAHGGGMLLSNTHFPSWGEKAWHEVHLTVGDEIDAYGASLVGVPVVNLGFNAHVAWTHTVSYAPRFVGYFLALDPEDPTRYRFDGGWEAMTPTTFRVEVADGGGVRTVERTLWRSRYGPVIEAPVVGWSDSLAISIGDVNASNTGIFDVWFRMNQATSLDELVAAQAETGGIPWVYTLAADPAGEVFFGDLSRVPYLSDAAIAAWRASLEGGPTAFIARQFADFGVIGVDGSDPLYAWVDDPEAADPGIVPPSRAPQDRRTDYVFNANDSHWLHNVGAPLTGYAEALYGAERTPRSARTRMNGRFLDEQGEGTASGADGRFDLAEVEAAALSMRSSLVEVALDAVRARCAGLTSVRHDGADLDVTAACATLDAWSGRYTADAKGAVLWRELLSAFDAGDLNDQGGGLFTTPFDPDDPLGTPRDVIAAVDADPGARFDPDPVRRALAAAVARLADLGWAPDVALGEVQHQLQGDPEDPVRQGVPGANYWEGTIGIADWSGGAQSTVLPYPTRPPTVNATSELTDDGYFMNNGNSFILAVEMGTDGPRARAVMTYSQSEDWRSPHLADQGPIYAGGSLRPVAFTEAEIAADTVEQLTLTRE
ncbi:MAG: penicillin acylase family protein [Alphaproteobacteria bacterium]|nr:penicillin acylase family protein [Alphaproteobacteria bacterium]